MASGNVPSSGQGGFSFDQIIRQLPQLFSMAEDMHNLTEYINHLRILTFVLVVMGIVGGIVFLFYKLKYRSGSHSMPADEENQCFIDGDSPHCTSMMPTPHKETSVSFDDRLCFRVAEAAALASDPVSHIPYAASPSMPRWKMTRIWSRVH
ncbi:unnamed protein product [Soboliphyme baturini]|uniref:Secreted protein n=1 Tax=Soboliphyme baturini TaxID=241478 RepID=A0A183IES1_9BILA|nr:unnamed protein product [Soboliphyme baturini]